MNLKLDIPAIQDSFYGTKDISSVRIGLAQIQAKYGDIISLASGLTKVPENIIKSFIWIESAGNEGVNTTGSEQATGLMQLTPAVVYDTINLEIKKKRLTQAERDYLNQFINVDDFSSPYSDIKDTIIAVLSDKMFNIFAGALLLGQLIDMTPDGQNMRMDKVVVLYNQGVYSSAAKSSDFKDLALADFYKTLNPITKAYVLKLIGQNGTLDILTA